MTTEALGSLLSALGRAAPNDEVEIVGADPILQTRFRIGEACAATLAAIGLVVSDIWELRTGHRQQVRVGLPLAAAALTSFAFQRVENGETPRRGPRLTDFYGTKDGRWYLLHSGFPKNQEATLKLLDCAPEKEAIAKAVSTWDAQALEDEMGERGLCGAMVRDAASWHAHVQGQDLAKRPVVEVIQVGDSPPEPVGSNGRPLSGVRILDLTRVLAGPTCGRTLAEHGADVLRIDSPNLPSVPAFVMDTGHGKRSAHLDLTNDADAEQLRALVREADVFTQGYRLGSLDRLGFGFEALQALRPGLVYTSINCYGHEGPWRNRPGWEQLAQTVTGIAAEHGGTKPRLLPAAATDYTTGYLAALGTLIALTRRATEGGTYLVRVSLSRTGMWIDRLGRTESAGEGLTAESVRSVMTVSDTPYGRIRHLRPVLELSVTHPHWALPTVPLGTHKATWP